MNLTSPAFENGQLIPQKYGAAFENVSPPLAISDVPPEAKSLVLVMDDPDVPVAARVPVWDHWVLFDLPPETRELPEGRSPDVGVRGKGTGGELDYAGPQPPDREHRYFFRLYALDVPLGLPEGSIRQAVLEAAEGHVVAQTELMGRFSPGLD